MTSVATMAGRQPPRYVDPAASVVIDAIETAMRPIRADVMIARERTGVVLITDRGPLDSIRLVAAGARDGFVSPLRFAAAAPVSLVGTACIALGFRGPTLTVTTSGASALAAARTLATYYITHGVVDYCFIVTLAREGDAHRVTAELLRASP